MVVRGVWATFGSDLVRKFKQCMNNLHLELTTSTATSWRPSDPRDTQPSSSLRRTGDVPQRA